MCARQAELAWRTGDDPGRPEFHGSVAREVSAAILAALTDALPDENLRFADLTALGQSDGAAGRYCLRLGDERHFVRVSARPGEPALEADIVAFLAAEGLPVIPFGAAGMTLNWHGARYRVDLRPLVPGRHFDGAMDDTEALARGLAACHAALRRYPRAPAVRGNAEARHRRLSGAVGKLRIAISAGDFEIFGKHADWARRHRDWLKEISEKFIPDFERRDGAQVLHGEIHPGNVLFRFADGAPVLLDFEESVATFAPPDWDIAYLLQRFSLRGANDSDSARAAIAPALSAYGITSIDFKYCRETCWSAMATILDSWVSGQIETPASEYLKFRELDRQAVALFGAAG